MVPPGFAFVEDGTLRPAWGGAAPCPPQKVTTLEGHGYPPIDSIDRLLDGEPGAIGNVALWTAVRMAVIGGALYLVGERDHLVRNAVVGGVAAEAFFIGVVAVRRHVQT
jgi:hypothetical protein